MSASPAFAVLEVFQTILTSVRILRGKRRNRQNTRAVVRQFWADANTQLKSDNRYDIIIY